MWNCIDAPQSPERSTARPQLAQPDFRLIARFLKGVLGSLAADAGANRISTPSAVYAEGTSLGARAGTCLEHLPVRQAAHAVGRERVALAPTTREEQPHQRLLRCPPDRSGTRTGSTKGIALQFRGPSCGTQLSLLECSGRGPAKKIMTRSIASAADPDGQPLMNLLTDLEVDPREAYNTVQGVQNMAGQDVIAALEAKSVETNAQFAKTNARVTENAAEARAMFKSLGTELRIIKWMLGILLAMGGVLGSVVVGVLLYLLPSDPAPIEEPVATAVVEELDDPADPPTTDPKVTDQAAARKAPK